MDIKLIEDKKEWEEFISLHPEANFLQSWDWGEFHLNLGKKIHRIGITQQTKLKGVMLCVIEDAKRGRYLTIPGGPIIDWQDKSSFKMLIEYAKDIAKKDKCVFIRVRPQLLSDDFSKALFVHLGFIDAPTHLHAELTTQLDLSKSEGEIMKNMRKGTRYEIRKAVTEGIVVKSSTDPGSIKEFFDLQIQTSKRQGFVPFSYKFLFEQFKIFSMAGSAVLYSAKFENKLLAQAFIIFYGSEAVYHYGASTTEGRNHPGAYLIQWEAIREAKRRGMKRYNLWGVSPEEQKNHRFYGISIFKRGFGGNDIEYLHAQDLVINKLGYKFNYLVEIARKKIRHV